MTLQTSDLNNRSIRTAGFFITYCLNALSRVSTKPPNWACFLVLKYYNCFCVIRGVKVVSVVRREG